MSSKTRGCTGVFVVLVMTLLDCRSNNGEELLEQERAADNALAVESLDGVSSELESTLSQTTSDDSETVISALETLQQMQDPRCLWRLVELLQDDDNDVVCLTARVVGSLGEMGRLAAPNLSNLLSHRSGSVRQCALAALSRVGGDQALSSILEHIEAPQPADLEYAIVAAGQLGRIEATPIVVGFLESSDETIRLTAIEALERIGAGAAGGVRPLLESSASNARCAAARMLAGWESLDDIPGLERMSRYDPEPRVRLCALGALGRLGDEEAIEELIERASDSESDNREIAVEALGIAATRSAVETLIRVLTGFPEASRPNPAQMALLEIGRTARPLLEDALPTGPPLRRALVAETLGLLGDPAAEESLEQASMDTDPLVREAATFALELLNE